MSMKQRVLMCLQTLESDLSKVSKTYNKEMLVAVIQNMAITKNVCLQGLPSKNSATYDKIYDQMMLAAKEMGDSDRVKIKKYAFSQCMEHLKHLIHKTERETKFKKDIVFLPYSASMWDSLESVWKAAQADKEHCNAYVMPIPYAELNPDKSVAGWRCEREEFPKYVPTLDWKEIDLKAWHPDVIFIHNPYDEINLVTSVESRYYSYNLKQCTDKLIYIPYSVEEEVRPGDEAIEATIAHRVLVPGVINADLVIAQSEDTRQAWINILARYTDISDRAYWEKKILGLGSPKIDKVLTDKKEDYELPEKWKKLIEGKKVILYLTSISAALQNSDKVCDKLRHVFDVFRNRDDVVLWWRPHPLMKSTFHSMLPQYEVGYLSLEKQYIEEGWGIYDDSSDLHRAICWSDAYYGDYSSVMTLYKYTKKAIILQNIGGLEMTRNIDIVGDDGYLVDACTGTLCKVNILTGVTQIVDQIPVEYISTMFSYSMVCYTGKKIIILPEQENRILEYDLDNRNFRELMTLEKKNSEFTGGTFVRYVKYGDCAYFIGLHQGSIIKYDTKHDNCESLNGHWSIIDKTLSYEERQASSTAGWLGYAYQDNDELLIPLTHTNKLLCMNFNDDTFTMETVDGLSSIQDITKYRDCFYFLQLNGKVFGYIRGNDGTWLQKAAYVNHWDSDENSYPYFMLENIGKKLLLFPGGSHYLTVIDTTQEGDFENIRTNGVWMFSQKLSEEYHVSLSREPGNIILHFASGTEKRDVKLDIPDSSSREIDLLLNDQFVRGKNVLNNGLTGIYIYRQTTS